jgi:hypothetical protein
MKALGEGPGKKAPKGSQGTGVQTGLSEQSKFDADNVRSAGPEANKEQARCATVMEKAGKFEFYGNSGGGY